jgi:hypothetical protein
LKLHDENLFVKLVDIFPAKGLGERSQNEISIRKILCILIIFQVLMIFPAKAQEIYYYRGASYRTDSSNNSTTWGLTYLEGLGEYAAWSLSYLNEGRIEEHKRDGLGALLWGRLPIFNRHVALAAGAGPYFYYDTIISSNKQSFSNEHGMGAMLSLTSTLYTESRFLIQVRTNMILTHQNLNTYVVALGIGYQLEKTLLPGPLTGPAYHDFQTTDKEITLSAGVTNLDAISDRHAAAESAEFRCGLARHVDWAIGWLNEEHPVSRAGPFTQVWVVQSFFYDKLAIGVGTGPYLVFDSHGAHEFKKVNLLVSGTFSYRFHPHWGLRISWNRVATDHDRDADVVLYGISYRF